MNLFIPRKGWTLWDVIRSWEDSGYKKGRSAGAYVAGDLSELQQTILLCPMCKHGFDWKKHRYYNVAHYEQIHAAGKCDKCKMPSSQLELFIHESNKDTAWMTKDQQRALRANSANQ